MSLLNLKPQLQKDDPVDISDFFEHEEVTLVSNEWVDHCCDCE
ncbi:hypothetical protein [Photobacterium leiognathi]|nr:hypothetical protein [Photobacterium leiognathi]